jgi:hypothetical protein
MKTYQIFWSEEKRQVAELCEDKNTRLEYDNLQEVYFIVRKNKDGSVYHDKSTHLFTGKNINEVREFIKQF